MTSLARRLQPDDELQIFDRSTQETYPARVVAVVPSDVEVVPTLYVIEVGDAGVPAVIAHDQLVEHREEFLQQHSTEENGNG